MKRLYFTFSTKLTFDNYVHDHSVALRCIPPETEVQHIVKSELNITPLLPTEQTVDAFGNNVTAGYLKAEHRFLDFEVRGIAEVDSTKHSKDYMPCYRYQSRLTKPGDSLKAFAKEIAAGMPEGDVNAKAKYLSEKVNSVMSYQKNTTSITTTAEEAFSQHCGVCQDFSHVLLSLMRINDIPCRYVAGLASCDGETHSWVQYWTEDGWVGIDPTNDCLSDDNYLMLSRGRDYADCSIDRGVMLGAYTRQMQLISSNLSEQAI